MAIELDETHHSCSDVYRDSVRDTHRWPGEVSRGRRALEGDETWTDSLIVAVNDCYT
jgi:hypothetical protein